MRSSGRYASPRRSAARGDRGLNETVLDPEPPLVERVDAEDGASDLGPARAHEAGEADDLAAPELERDVGEEAAAREALGPEDDVSELHLLLREELVERAPDHEPDDLRLGELIGRARLDVTAVADDGDDVGELADLLEPVADVEDGHAAVAQAADGGEEAVDLVGRECGGRLVHDQQPRTRRERLRDLEQLPVGDAESAHRGVGADLHRHLPEDAGRLGPHRPPVDDAEAGAEVAPGEDVLGDGQILEDRRLLVHRDDAQAMRGLRVGDPPRRALDRDLALVGLNDPGQDLDERRLAGAVLADERVDGAGADREAHLGDCLDAAVAPRDAAQLHERSGRRKRRCYAIVGVDSHELNGFKHIV